MILIRCEQSDGAAYRENIMSESVAFEYPSPLMSWDGMARASNDGAEVVVLGDGAGHASGSPDDDAESWLRSWSQSGWEQFDLQFREVERQLESEGKRLVIRPSSGGMLSDAVCTLNWCARGGGQSAQILLDPIGWIVPSMLLDIEDHLDRIVELSLEMIERGRVWGVMLRSLGWNQDQTGFESRSLSQGEPDGGMILTKLLPLMHACHTHILVDASDIARIEPGAASH